MREKVASRRSRSRDKVFVHAAEMKRGWILMTVAMECLRFCHCIARRRFGDERL